MGIRKIVTVGDENPVLRQAARPVRRVNRHIKRLLDDMLITMREADGVGLAAPQIDVDLQVIVVEVPLDPEDPGTETQVFGLVNPEIVWQSEDTAEDREACLSIPGLFGDVPRHVSIRVTGLNRYGEAVELELADFDARVFQHEIDHLHGTLFTDRVTGMDKLYTLEENEAGELVRVPLETQA